MYVELFEVEHTATQTQEFLRTIQQDDFCLVFEPVENYLAVTVISDDTFQARQKLKIFTTTTCDLLNKYNLNNNGYMIPNEFELEMEMTMQVLLLQ